MRVLWIGFGQAGGKLADMLVQQNEDFYDGVAINTDEADLSGVRHIRDKVLIGRYLLNGRGSGASIEMGTEIAEKALSQVMDTISDHDRKFSPEAFWILAGLAGGTGAGGAHILAREVKAVFNKPVYAVGILPSTSEMPSDKEALYISNTLKSLELWKKYFDNILLLDNQQYEGGMDTRESVEHMYHRINQDLTVRLTTMLGAGEVRPAPQEVFSSSEIIATLGEGGQVSSLGFKSERVKTRTAFWEGGIDPDSNELENLIMRSIDRSALTFPCAIEGVRAAGLIPHAKPEYLFTQAIIKGRAFLEDTAKVGDVRYGDYPDEHSPNLSVLTILSGIDDFSRLDQLKDRFETIGAGDLPQERPEDSVQP
jgi:cell division GTPase FtsZ